MSSPSQRSISINSSLPLDSENNETGMLPHISWDNSLRQQDNSQTLENTSKESRTFFEIEENYVPILRKAFDAADIKHDNKLTQEEWDNSSLRPLVHRGNLSKSEFSLYFKKIDANYKGYITWEELTFFLMKEMNTGNSHSDNDSVQFITKANTTIPPRSMRHRDMISKILICQRTQEYITLSSDSIRFWSPADLSLRRVITDPGGFSNFLVFENGFFLAVTTVNRRLIFFNIDTLIQLPIQVCASPSGHEIRAMSEKDALASLLTLKSSLIPLFNIPTSMGEATLPNTPVNTFFVGDDKGSIEAFHLIAPQSRQGTEYEIDRIGQRTIHNSTVTQITAIPSLACYASSSADGSIHFWTFNTIGNTFAIVRSFFDKSAINSFIYNERQSIVVTCGISREATIWTLCPPAKVNKLGGHYNQVILVTEFATDNDIYLLTMTSKKEFRLWDAVNWRIIREWSDTLLQGADIPYSTGIFDFKRRCLITTTTYPVKWCEDVVAYEDSVELLSVQHPIINCHYSKVFHQILVVDELSNFAVYNLLNSTKENQHSEFWTPDIPKLVVSTLDPKGRRLVTVPANDTPTGTLWNFNSGGKISSIDFCQKDTKKGIISDCKFIQVQGRTFLIRAGWNKQLMLYVETYTGQFDLYRECNGHQGDVTSIIGFSHGFISGDANGTLMVWDVDNSSPQCSIRIPSSVECLSICSGFLIVGDSQGRLYTFLLPKLSPTYFCDGHRLKNKIPIASIVSLFSDNDLNSDDETQITTSRSKLATTRTKGKNGSNTVSNSIFDDYAASLDSTKGKGNGYVWTLDTNGYFKKWEMKEGRLNGKEIVKSHQCSGRGLEIIPDGPFIITWGTDRCARIWDGMSMKYIGYFSPEANWSLSSPDTWQNEPPFEKDEEQFKPADSKIEPSRSVIRGLFLQVTPTLRSLKSALDQMQNLPSSPHLTSNGNHTMSSKSNLFFNNSQMTKISASNTCRDFDNEESMLSFPEKELDFNEVGKALEEFVSEGYGAQIKERSFNFQRDQEELESGSQSAHILQTYARPSDLSAKMNCLIQRPQTSISSSKKERKSYESRIIRPNVKPPPMSYSSLRKGMNRVPLSLNI